MNWLTKIWNWVLSLFDIKPGPVKIGDRCYMPLFPWDKTYGIMMTWDYLAWSDAKKKVCRDAIKAGATSSETPAITMCLTPAGCTGGMIDDKMTAITDTMLDLLEKKVVDLVKDGIAVFPCLYVDDATPRWFEIEKHQAIWKRVHGRIGRYVTGYILSIETNEQASNVGHLQGCINVMRECMPGADFYGTHLQWKSRGRYSWTGGSSTPSNANIILVETPNNPHNGDAYGVAGVIRDYNEIKTACPALKFVMHEFNVNSNSGVGKAQTEALRNVGAWGAA
jgi:hypothetical protein